MKKSTARTLAALLAAAFLFACACVPEREKRTATFFDYFDTVITLVSYSDKAAFDEAAAAAEEIFSSLNKLFDIYHEYDNVVNLAAVNRMAGERTEVDPAIAELVSAGKEYFELTRGAVNIAMGAVLRLWHDARINAEEDPEHASLPDEAALAEAAKHCSIDDVIVEGNTVLLRDPEMSLDVGAIAKGYAADRVAEKLGEMGVSFMLNCGGAVLTNGKKPGGEDWIAGIADPAAAGEGFAAKVAVDSAALSTSGSYLRSFTVDGKTYGHIIDPATLRPAEGTASVSVLCVGISAMTADALSTACFVLGAGIGGELIEGVEGASALFVLPSGEKIASGGFPER
ncbi:MAG: FAD:protein FMN transferase [Clostridia bacterium]|nr:FAD:protein FMN transferase [Clostridia bacterium]